MRGLRRGARDTPGRLVVVEAEAGIGKSMFLGEARQMASRKRLRVFEGAGSGLEPDEPYYAWRTVFQQLFEVDMFLTDRRTRRSHVLRQLPPIRGERGFPAFAIQMSPLLNAVLPLDLPENQTTAQMSNEVREKTTRQFLLRLLQRYVSGTSKRRMRPSLVILDNGQSMDLQSWELALEASREIKSLLILIATRPLAEQTTNFSLAQFGSRLLSEDHVERIRLGLFRRYELADLLWHEIGVQAISDDVLDLLMRRTGGRPAFAVAVTRQWLEEGLIELRGGTISVRQSLTELSQSPPPEEVWQSITGRIERLSPTQQLILKTASVIGESFSDRALSEMYPVKDELDNLLDNLQALAAAEFLTPLEPSEEQGYEFACNFHWQVSRSLLPTSLQSLLVGVDLGHSGRG